MVTATDTTAPPTSSHASGSQLEENPWAMAPSGAACQRMDEMACIVGASNLPTNR